MSILVIIAVITFLISVNGFYVAAEFSAVSARRPRLAQMADDGSRMADVMLGIVNDAKRLDAYVAACQLGITLSSLILGFYGQSRIMALLGPWMDQLAPATQAVVQSVSALVILILLTILQVVLGELVPKNVGLQYPEKLATITATPMVWSMRLFRPLIWFFNGSGQVLLRMIGAHAVAEHSHVHSPEEIMMLVEESSAGGLLDTEERRLLVNTLQLRDLTARKVMIPRNRMVVGSVDQSCGDLFKLLARSPYSRLPLYEGTIDNIVGVVHLKDLMRVQYSPMVADLDGDSSHIATDGTPSASAAKTVRAIMHPVNHVPDSVEIGEVMVLMQRAHLNLAIVVDEYGGTAGMLTVEDLIEEIIGEFEDEFDAENPPVALRDDQRIYVRSDVLVDDLNEALEMLLPSEGIDTMGGLMLKSFGFIPQAGDTITIADTDFRVERVYQQGIAEVSFAATPTLIEHIELNGIDL